MPTDKVTTDLCVLYDQWVKYVFDRASTDPKWFFNGDDAFSASDEEIVHLISMTFERSGADLARYTEAQVSDGLSYILYNYASNCVGMIMEKGVPEADRRDTIVKMKALYADCLAKRCDPILSHLDEVTENPLNMFCYMLWDESPLCQWQDVVIDVMEFALYLPNDACIESALHGLGHRMRQSPERVTAVIDKFLKKSKSIRPELRAYAQSARTGRIQ